LNCLNANLYDTRTFTNLPMDGVSSLNYPSVTEADNTPTNFAGASGSVNLITPSGDYNGDGIVDEADYIDWRRTLGEAASPAGTGADGDKDGTIGAGDYDFWQARFGNVVAGAGGGGVNAAAPEPATINLLLMSLAGGLQLFGLRPRRDPALGGVLRR
jgi:hypothetical protein